MNLGKLLLAEFPGGLCAVPASFSSGRLPLGMWKMDLGGTPFPVCLKVMLSHQEQ